MTQTREFMKLPQLDDFRQKREAFSVELRKKQRTEASMKRRVKHRGEEGWQVAVMRFFPQLSESKELTEVLPAIKEQLVSSPDLSGKHQSLQTIRLMLSNPSKAPIKEIVEAGFVPVLVKILDLAQFPDEMAVGFM
jgi:hypothetical protein